MTRFSGFKASCQNQPLQLHRPFSKNSVYVSDSAVSMLMQGQNSQRCTVFKNMCIHVDMPLDTFCHITHQLINYCSLCLHEHQNQDTVIDQLSHVIVQSLLSAQVKQGNLFIDRSMCDSAVMEGRPASF